jgi:hypothetical protein
MVSRLRRKSCWDMRLCLKALQINENSEKHPLFINRYVLDIKTKTYLFSFWEIGKKSQSKNGREAWDIQYA